MPFNVTYVSSIASFTRRGMALIVIQSFIFLILNIAAFVGNLLVCLAIYRNPSLRTVTNNFILSLALTDLLMAVVVMPVYTVSSLLDRWIGGEVFSQIICCCLLLAGYTSILHVALLAINRYFRVVRPQMYRNIYSKKSSAMMAVVTWVVTVVLVSSYPLLGVRYEVSESNPTISKLSFGNAVSHIYIYAIFLASLYRIVPVFVIVICYVKIFKTIHQHNTAAAPSTQEGNSPYGVEEAKITRLLTAVVVGFCLCWFPTLIFRILDIFKLVPSTVFKYIVFISVFPIFTSSVVNPIIYGFLNQSFRSEFLKIIRLK